MGSQKRDYTRGKEEEGNGKNTGAAPQSDGESPGRLAAPCFGVSAPSPVGCTGRQMVSFLQTLLSSVREPLWKEGGKKSKGNLLASNKGAVLLQNLVAMEKISL